MSDRLTILRSAPNLPLAKVWRAGGTIEPYNSAKHFTPTIETVEGIGELSALLTRLENDSNACLIRGAPIDQDKRSVRRLLENFRDDPLHTLLIEVDEFRPLCADPVKEPVDAALEFISECLPSVFHDASFHWQLSNSAGKSGAETLLKIHLWFWMSSPYDSATLRAWATAATLQLDRAVLQPVQIHYLSAPIFDPGVLDPVPLRSGFHCGAQDSVDLEIDVAALDIRPSRARQRDANRQAEDPQADWIERNWETWGVLSHGGIAVSCPFEQEHSGGAQGDTSTVYFPAGTGGYTAGAWVCLHNSCRDRPQGEYPAKTGYLDDRFAALAEPKPAAANGVELTDPLVLPPMQRDGKSNITATIGNVCAALTRNDLSGIDLRYDTFKDSVVCADPGQENWRPFLDTDYTDLRIRLEKRLKMPTIGREMIRDAVHKVSKDNAFDTGIDWLESLVWDGVPRIDSFWTEHFGVLDDKAGYARAVARYAWTAMAGRVLQPGVQADMVPILVGGQGLRKSRGVLALAPAEEFATSMSFHESEVERARKMRGRMVVELAELQGLKSREREEILAWVTRSSEHWTPKFMEMTTAYKRRFLMFGTTNARDFLDDDEERRWLPLDVGLAKGFVRVDTERLERERDQLWAEGAVLFREQGILWADAERLARDEHGKFKAEDSWRVSIVKWLDTPDIAGETPSMRKYLTTTEISEGALSLPARSIKSVDQRRVGKIMRQEGYELQPRKVDGRSTKVWFRLGFV